MNLAKIEHRDWQVDLHFVSDHGDPLLVLTLDQMNARLLAGALAEYCEIQDKKLQAELDRAKAWEEQQLKLREKRRRDREAKKLNKPAGNT